ncbi:MAG: GDSL-type esterase/lipase family protein [Phycisphaerales bacterium]
MHTPILAALVLALSFGMLAPAQPAAPATPAQPTPGTPTPVAPPKPSMPSAPATPTPPAATKPATPPKAITPADIKGEPRNDDWWKKMHEQFLTRTKQGAEKGDIGVVFLGDSITQGWGGEGKDAWARNFARLNAVNYGIGGDRTTHVLWRVQNGELDGLALPKAGSAPKVVVLMIGTNDAGGNIEPETIAAGIKACVAAIRAKLPQTKVLLLAVLPRSEKPDELRERCRRTNELAKDVADGKNVIWQDDWAKFVKEDGTIDKAIMPDVLHLSPAGYDRWAGLIAPTLERLTK